MKYVYFKNLEYQICLFKKLGKLLPEKNSDFGRKF
jgi:hypothetical protein